MLIRSRARVLERSSRLNREKRSGVPCPPLPTPVQASGKRDLRTFITEKAPASDAHFATAVAYYYQFEAPEIALAIPSASRSETPMCHPWSRSVYVQPSPARTWNGASRRSSMPLTFQE